MHCLLRGAAAAAFLFCASAAPCADAALQIEPHMFRLADGSEIEVERGRFTVPEDRGDPNSRRIGIGFVRFPSTNPDPGPPIVYLAGGPGGSGARTAEGPRQPIFMALRQVADVIALDQRGVGLSNELPPCAADAPLDPQLGLSEATLTAYYRATLNRCVERWRAAGIAFTGYTTEQSADDLEDLRRALGAERLDLWGISYGTHLALAMMRRHPDSVGRVALSSVEGLTQTVKLPAHVDAVFRRIETLASPGLVALIQRVHDRYDAAPQLLSVRLANGETVEFRTDAFALRMLAGFIPKNPDGVPDLERTYRALDAGRTEELAPLIHRLFYGEPLSVGMSELMDVASGIDPARYAEFRRQAAVSLVGTALNFPMPQLRGAVPGLDLGADFREEIVAEHPVLVFSGDLDVRTPLAEQEAAIQGLRNRHEIRVENGGHDLFEAHPDVPAILVDFFSGRPVTTRRLVLEAPTRAR